MKDIIEELSAEYSEIHTETNRLTFTQENWIKFSEAISEKAVTFDPNGFELMGEGIEYWKNLQVYAKENMMDELIKDKVVIEFEGEKLKEDLEAEKKTNKDLEAKLDEFIESGWEANGNKLYFKGEAGY